MDPLKPVTWGQYRGRVWSNVPLNWLEHELRFMADKKSDEFNDIVAELSRRQQARKGLLTKKRKPRRFRRDSSK